MIELGWLRKTDFFPSRPAAWAEQRTLCIGTKNRTLGDALVLTTLPEKIHAAYSGVRVFTFGRGFNPIVFRGNPYLDGVQRLPRRIYGDDANWGEGQLIQLKERFFDLPVSAKPRPQIYLSPSERSWAKKFIASHAIPPLDPKPLCVIHPWGGTRGSVAPVEYWDELVKRWSHAVRFWQVGIQGHGAVQGCEYYLFLPPSVRSARKLFALMSCADAFVGVDSGPMHVARAFDVPSMIWLNHIEAPALDEQLKLRGQSPYFLHQSWKFSVLYDENRHVCVGRDSQSRRSALDAAADSFMNSFVSKTSRRDGQEQPTSR